MFIFRWIAKIVRAIGTALSYFNKALLYALEIIIVVAVIISVFSMTKSPQVQPNSILVLDLEGTIKELPSADMGLSPVLANAPSNVSLHELLATLECLGIAVGMHVAEDGGIPELRTALMGAQTRPVGRTILQQRPEEADPVADCEVRDGEVGTGLTEQEVLAVDAHAADIVAVAEALPEFAGLQIGENPGAETDEVVHAADGQLEFRLAGIRQQFAFHAAHLLLVLFVLEGIDEILVSGGNGTDAVDFLIIAGAFGGFLRLLGGGDFLGATLVGGFLILALNPVEIRAGVAGHLLLSDLKFLERLLGIVNHDGHIGNQLTIS